MKKISILLLLLISITSVAQDKKSKQTEASSREVVVPSDAPKAVGPYSMGIKAGGFVFTAGQLPLDPATGKLAGDDVATQTEQVLRAAGTSMDRVVKTTVFLRHMSDFAAMNEVYGKHFKESPPARSTVEVGGLARDAIVEIEAVALLH